MERMEERRLTKRIHKAKGNGIMRRNIPRRSWRNGTGIYGAGQFNFVECERLTKDRDDSKITV